MLEALWSVDFSSNVQGFGSGVVVLESGRVLGGDAQYFYVGSYSVENGVAHAKVTITHYAGPSNTVFGQAKSLTLQFSGTPSREQFELQGSVVGSPGLSIRVRFVRRAELP